MDNTYRASRFQDVAIGLVSSTLPAVTAVQMPQHHLLHPPRLTLQAALRVRRHRLLHLPYLTLPAHAPSSFHLTETQDCEANSSNNLYCHLIMRDDNKAIIGQTVNDDDHPFGYAMDDDNPYLFTSKLLNPLVVIGEHEHDYVQFTYGSISWQSKTPSDGGSCTVGRWDPRDGPTCGLRFGNQNAVC